MVSEVQLSVDLTINQYIGVFSLPLILPSPDVSLPEGAFSFLIHSLGKAGLDGE